MIGREVPPSFPVDGNKGASASVVNPLHSLRIEALSRTGECRGRRPLSPWCPPFPDLLHVGSHFSSQFNPVCESRFLLIAAKSLPVSQGHYLTLRILSSRGEWRCSFGQSCVHNLLIKLVNCVVEILHLLFGSCDLQNSERGILEPVITMILALSRSHISICTQ